MSANDELRENVVDELYWDPKVDSYAVAVSADDGTITLRGTVGSLREKREAQKDAERVFGVVAVDNQLQVRLLDAHRRDDADLRGDVLKALMLDSVVPETVDAKVDDGFVTLTGSVNWKYQRDEAELVVSNIVGTLDVLDAIEIRHPKPNAEDVKESIRKAFKRNASLDAGGLDVSTEDGTVTIRGTVSSWAEHDQALNAAWSAPGVARVHDRMKVVYS